MRTRTFIISAAVVALAMQLSWTQTPSGNKSQQSLTVDNVIEMVQAGVSEEIVITRLTRDSRAFDLSTDDMIRLKKAKVSDAIVKAMLVPQPGRKEVATMANNPLDDAGSIPLKPGFYVNVESGWKPLELAKLESENTTPGSIFTVRNMQFSEIIAGSQAALRIGETQPRFCFVKSLDAVRRQADNPFSRKLKAEDLKDLLALLRMSSLRGDRRIEYGKVLKGEITKNESIPLVLEEDSEKAWIFRTASSLAPGEYLFKFAPAFGRGAIAYDFGVGPAEDRSGKSGEPATVIVYRNGGEIQKPSVFVDSDEVLKLSAGRYCALKVNPGRVSFALDGPANQPVRITIEPNQTYYLIGKQPFGAPRRFEIVSQEKAQSDMKKLKPVDPELVKNPKMLAAPI